jgi:integrase
MATVEKVQRREGTVYKAKVRRQGHETVCKSFKTRSDAERWARKLEAGIDRDDAGLTNEGQKHTLADAIARYRAEVLPDLRPETARKYEQHLAFWGPKLGHLRLSELAPAKIAETRDELTAAGKAPATVNRHLATLAAVLTACMKRWHWLTASPMRQVQKPTERNHGTRFLSEPELARLLDACRQSESADLYLAVLLSITTGARAGEILGLRWSDLDLTAGTMVVRADAETTTKGGARSLPIVAEALGLLPARRDAERQGKVTPLYDAGLVFPSRVTRSKPVSLRTPWETALRRAGIESFRWHDLRHSAASLLAKGGASLLEIGAVLGHKSANTTKRYSHLTEKRTHDLVRGMANRILNGSTS